jgi:hypothetical protein
MEIVIGVFDNAQTALDVVNELRSLGLSEKEISYVTPKSQGSGTAARVPLSDTEDSGMGQAMGAAVGGAIGAAGGATLGLAAASLLVPGVGPVLAFGLLGAALVGAPGAIAGAVIGDSLEENLGEGFPHEDIYVFQDALRHGRSVVLAYAQDTIQGEKAREIMDRAGAIDIDELRENWWRGIRAEESANYQSDGRDFKRDELSYRRGFEAAQHPSRAGKSYSTVEADLRKSYSDDELNDPFRCGYDRGSVYCQKLKETPKV